MYFGLEETSCLTSSLVEPLGTSAKECEKKVHGANYISF